MSNTEGLELLEENSNEKKDEMKVIISRGGFRGGGMEIEVSKLSGVRWDDTTGGVGKRLPYYSLFAYVPYVLIADSGVACSGRHTHYGNSAKVEIPKGINQDAKYRAGYEYLVEKAGGIRFKPSKGGRSGLPYCRRRIKQILGEVGVVERSELIDKLVGEGYMESTAKNVLRTLTREFVIDKSRENKQTVYRLKNK